MRPYGYYFVRVADLKPMIAEWTPRGWFVTGEEAEFVDDNFAWIGLQQISMPAEAFATVNLDHE